MLFEKSTCPYLIESTSSRLITDIPMQATLETLLNRLENSTERKKIV